MNFDSYWSIFSQLFFFFLIYVTSWGEALYSKDCVASTLLVDFVTGRLKQVYKAVWPVPAGTLCNQLSKHLLFGVSCDQLAGRKDTRLADWSSSVVAFFCDT